LPFSYPTYHDVRDVSELPPHIFDEIMHFFTVYKQLENKQTAVKELFGHQEAERIIEQAIADYGRLFGSTEGAQGCESDE
jgi:inorganic pyrophosphatase